MSRRRRRHILSAVLIHGSILLLGVYLVVQLVMNQMAIGGKRQELEEVQNQLIAQRAQNAELSRILESGDELDIIERVARDTLGYAKPNERIFVDMSGK